VSLRPKRDLRLGSHLVEPRHDRGQRDLIDAQRAPPRRHVQAKAALVIAP
jgi:hypothetical protein